MPLPHASDAPSAQLVRSYQAGDGTAATAICDRYARRLAALAQSRLSQRLAARIDPDDIVQSALVAFFQGCANGEYAIEYPGELWNLLAAITVNKARRQIEYHRAKKRSVHTEVALLANDSSATLEPIDLEPSAHEVAIAEEELAWLLERLDPLQRRAVEMRLVGHDAPAIANALGPTERTIRRWLSLAERLLRERANRTDAHDCRTRPTAAVQMQPTGVNWMDYRDLLLERQIGRGGIARVYRAYQRSTGRRVAVKVLTRRSCVTPELCDAFNREAQIVSRFSHPSIVATHGAGRLPNGAMFLALDYIEGQDLSQLLSANGRFPIARVIEIGIAVASALHYAHQLGVVHADVKPANVIQSADGRISLTDFGFAVLTKERRANQVTGGTLGYLAPELLDSNSKAITPAADIYALGATLATLLTGRPPSTGALTSPGDGPAKAVWQLIHSCLQPEPSDRPSDARRIADKLGSLRTRNAP